VKPTKHGR
jgi:hypothetical protein